ncbi:MAG TPA: SDR family oxidoreductase [Dehalococcoidia bacterium]|nr:SDR family oxidoreductase [Dehalococcoidia bacterium]
MTQATKFRTDAYAVRNDCHRYEGCVAVITGSAQGLGRVTAQRLAEEGASVVIADMQAERGQSTADELAKQTGRDILYVGGDLSTVDASQELVKRTVERFGRIDTFVACAAYQARQPFLEFPEDQMEKSVTANVWALVRPLQAILPVMMEQRYGRVVTIGGVAFENGGAWHSFLAGVGKGSVVGLTTTLAGEFGRFNITFNCVSPGGMETNNDGTDNSTAGGRDPGMNFTPQQAEKYLGPPESRGSNRAPLGRGQAHPSEVAAAIAFLGSHEASFITGQLLKVSAGTSML